MVLTDIFTFLLFTFIFIFIFDFFLYNAEANFQIKLMWAIFLHSFNLNICSIFCKEKYLQKRFRFSLAFHYRGRSGYSKLKSLLKENAESLVTSDYNKML